MKFLFLALLVLFFNVTSYAACSCCGMASCGSVVASLVPSKEKAKSDTSSIDDMIGDSWKSELQPLMEKIYSIETEIAAKRVKIKNLQIGLLVLEQEQIIHQEDLNTALKTSNSVNNLIAKIKLYEKNLDLSLSKLNSSKDLDNSFKEGMK